MANVVPIKKSKAEPTIGSVADAMHDLREQRRALDAQSAELKKQYDELEIQLMDLLDKQQVTRGDGKNATVSITESVVPTVKDWDELWAYIFKNKAKQLMQLRVSVEAWRELTALKQKPLPGVESYTKRVINLRNK
jgi:hypothetical protein